MAAEKQIRREETNRKTQGKNPPGKLVSCETWRNKLWELELVNQSKATRPPGSKAPSVNSDWQHRAVESVGIKERVFITPEGKNPWSVGKINGCNNVWLASNRTCKQERSKRIRRPIRSDQNTDRTAYKEMLDNPNNVMRWRD